ncbi:hypothetical protein TNCV_5140491 [Trichonephila clavipes]|nr:hypothetical protein TNCV_5140491 [Trichonephila clavipes]
MKHGYPISPRESKQQSINSDTHPFPSRSNPNKRCQSVRLWLQCSGTGAVFCWWTLCHKRNNINSGAYNATLRKLRRALKNTRRGMLSKGVLLLHDNARPHTTGMTLK